MVIVVTEAVPPGQDWHYPNWLFDFIVDSFPWQDYPAPAFYHLLDSGRSLMVDLDEASTTDLQSFRDGLEVQAELLETGCIPFLDKSAKPMAVNAIRHLGQVVELALSHQIGGQGRSDSRPDA